MAEIENNGWVCEGNCPDNDEGDDDVHWRCDECDTSYCRCGHGPPERCAHDPGCTHYLSREEELSEIRKAYWAEKNGR